ncbi:MAG: hypothetical protein LBP61_05990 [Desulfovibrio sp.]|jgi:hypothetical protein|nr:hypothetical protein [Desulfovibrio sp.]
MGQDGRVCRIRIRRRNTDLDPNNPKDVKYMLVPQASDPYSAPLCLLPRGVSQDMATWVIVESELDAMAVHHACGGSVGVLAVLTVNGKPDVATHRHLLRAVRILTALDVDQDKEDGSNPGANAWPWWERTYSHARLWPVPEGKDPGEAFALGVDLGGWVSKGMPVGNPVSVGRETGGVSVDDPSRGQEGKSEEDTSAEDARNGVLGGGCPERCWRVPRVATLEEVRFPPDIAQHLSPQGLLKAFRSRRDRPLAECLVLCPRTNPPFWWTYMASCARCSGHPLCLIGLVQSKIFQEALHAH